MPERVTLKFRGSEKSAAAIVAEDEAERMRIQDSEDFGNAKGQTKRRAKRT